MKYDRLLYLGFLAGDSLDYLDDESGMCAGFSESRVRAYVNMLGEAPRTHYRHRDPQKWQCGSGKTTRDKNRVTCRRCLEYVDRITPELRCAGYRVEFRRGASP